MSETVSGRLRGEEKIREIKLLVARLLRASRPVAASFYDSPPDIYPKKEEIQTVSHYTLQRRHQDKRRTL